MALDAQELVTIAEDFVFGGFCHRNKVGALAVDVRCVGPTIGHRRRCLSRLVFSLSYGGMFPVGALLDVHFDVIVFGSVQTWRTQSRVASCRTWQEQIRYLGLCWYRFWWCGRIWCCRVVLTIGCETFRRRRAARTGFRRTGVSRHDGGYGKIGGSTFRRRHEQRSGTFLGHDGSKKHYHSRSPLEHAFPAHRTQSYTRLAKGKLAKMSCRRLFCKPSGTLAGLIATHSEDHFSGAALTDWALRLAGSLPNTSKLVAEGGALFNANCALPKPRRSLALCSHHISPRFYFQLL